MDPKARDNALERIPLKRFGKPEEIAEAALFLARNEYANNCVVNLDGGLSAAVSRGNLLRNSRHMLISSDP
jgi:NAD(P)-dependent dehydrogenase (short-subunit alcohol dehydrogenase family)